MHIILQIGFQKTLALFAKPAQAPKKRAKHFVTQFPNGGHAFPQSAFQNKKSKAIQNQTVGNVKRIRFLMRRDLQVQLHTSTTTRTVSPFCVFTVTSSPTAPFCIR